MSNSAWSNGPRGQQGQTQVAQNDPEEFMNKLFAETVGNNVEAMTYKPASGASNTKAGTWTKQSAPMANGKDFFAELRRQVASLAEKEKVGG